MDGHYFYVSDNFTGRLYAIDTVTRTIVTDVAVGLAPALITRSPDGGTLYVANGKSHSVSVVDIAQPASPVVRLTINVSGYPHGLAVTPDGRYVVVAETFGKDVAVIDTVTNMVVANITGMTFPNDVLIP
jgi:YVTN family beta-propeller protein